MPLLMVYGPDISADRKAELARDMTARIAERYRVPTSMVSIFFVPLGPDDAFHDGKPTYGAENDAQ
jgi:phenylpyruvate tautomerase PptA (4-oxalocrotonate tautomerase family)